MTRENLGRYSITAMCLLMVIINYSCQPIRRSWVLLRTVSSPLGWFRISYSQVDNTLWGVDSLSGLLIRFPENLNELSLIQEFDLGPGYRHTICASEKIILIGDTIELFDPKTREFEQLPDEFDEIGIARSCLVRQDGSAVILGQNWMAFYNNHSWEVQMDIGVSGLSAISEDMDGNLWLGTNNGDLFIYNSYNSIDYSGNVGESPITKIRVLKNDNLLVGSLDGSIYELPINNNSEGVKLLIQFIQGSDSGQLEAASAISRFFEAAQTGTPGESVISPSIPDTKVTYAVLELIENSDGTIWLFGSGANMLAYKDGGIEQVPMPFGSSGILSVAFDIEGGMLFLSTDKGIYYQFIDATP